MSSVFVIVLFAILGAAVIGLVVWFVVQFILRRVMARVESNAAAQISQHFAGQDILLSTYKANCLGVESAGVLQVRGNGGLALTANELYFTGATGKELSIDRRSIMAVSEVRSHLAKTYFKPLLHVRYRTAEGEDSVAWLLPDLERWKAALGADSDMQDQSPN